MVGIVAAGIALAAYQAWVHRTGAVLDVIAQAERTDLLRAIEEVATEPHMPIELSGFWRGRGWNRRQRFCLLRPLIDRRILHIPYAADQFQRLAQELGYKGLCHPPGTVILNQRDWTRMATDRSGNEPSIIIGRISGGMNQIGGSHNIQSQQKHAAERMREVVEALEHDAPRAGPELQGRVLEAAAGLKHELRQGRWSRVAEWVTVVSALATASSDAMECTRKVLQTLGVL